MAGARRCARGSPEHGRALFGRSRTADPELGGIARSPVGAFEPAAARQRRPPACEEPQRLIRGLGAPRQASSNRLDRVCMARKRGSRSGAKPLDRESAEQLLQGRGWTRGAAGKHVVKMVKRGERPITLPLHNGRGYPTRLADAILRRSEDRGHGD
jgi:hypothetical protein